MRRFAYIIAFCFLAGCAASNYLISVETDQAITNSFSFRRVRAINPERARWFVDGTDGNYPVIYVGFDEGWHYTRSATLRVRDHYIIERQEMRDDGELTWVPDNNDGNKSPCAVGNFSSTVVLQKAYALPQIDGAAAHVLAKKRGKH
jgi:hypothetical protein